MSECVFQEFVSADGKVKDIAVVSMALKALCNLAANYSEESEGGEEKSSSSSSSRKFSFLSVLL